MYSFTHICVCFGVKYQAAKTELRLQAREAFRFWEQGASQPTPRPARCAGRPTLLALCPPVDSCRWWASSSMLLHPWRLGQILPAFRVGFSHEKRGIHNH